MKNNKKNIVHNDELSKRIASEISKCVDFNNSVLASQYETNIKHYLAHPLKGDDKIKGLSKYVAPITQERVDWFSASIIRVLDGQKSIVSFTPLTGSDQDKALALQQDRTVNHVLRERNSHIALLTPWIQNAAMYGLGIVNVAFEEEVTESIPITLKAVTDEALVQLTEDEKAGKLKFIERTEDYQATIPPGLAAQASQALGQSINPAMIAGLLPAVRDITIRRIKRLPRFKFTTVAVEDFIISKDADFDPQTGGISASVQGHRTYMTRQELIRQGHDKALVARIQTASDKNDGVAQERAAKTDYSTGISDAGNKVEVFEVCSEMAIDDDTPRHYRFTVAGDIENSPIVLNYEEVTNYYPYAALCPFPLPNTLFGQGIGDRTGSEQELITKIFRAVLDNLHYSVDPIKVVNPEVTEVDDVLNLHPGAVIRSEDPTAGISYTTPPFSGATALPVIEQITNRLDLVTGVGGQMVSIDASDLSDVTATAAKQRTNAQQILIEQVCRHFADTGYRYLCKIIIDLCVQKPDLAQRYIQRLTDGYTPFQVDEWDTDMDVTTNISFGLMDKDYKAATLQTLLALQQQALGSAATPANIHKTLVEIAENSGIQNAASYFTDPWQIPPPPPAPDPNAGIVEIEKVKAELRSQTDAAEREFEAWKLRAENDLERDRMAQDLELKKAEITAKFAADVDIARIQFEQERARNDIEWAIANQEATNQRREQEAARRQQEMQMMQQQMQPPMQTPPGNM